MTLAEDLHRKSRCPSNDDPQNSSTGTATYSNTPPSDKTSWRLINVGVNTPNNNFPAWSSSVTYHAGGAYGSNNTNARNVFLGCYAEDDNHSQYVGGREFVAGGIQSTQDITTPGVKINANQVIGFSAQYTQFDETFGQTFGQVDVCPPGFGPSSGSPNQRPMLLHLYWADGAGTPNFGHFYLTRENNDATFVQGDTRIFRVTGASTTLSFGRSTVTTTGSALVIYKGFLGVQQTTNDARAISYANINAFPQGDSGQGDLVINSQPAPGGNLGWICTTAGISGTNIFTPVGPIASDTGTGGGKIWALQTVTHTGVSFANLPSSPVRGMVASIIDNLVASPAWGSTVTVGGGGNNTLLWFNGAHWTVIGM
jgi:hypothetical protein